MALSVSGLTDYVNVHRDELLVAAVADSKTLRYVDIMGAVKYKDSIPYLDSSVVLDDGSACGFEAKGDDIFSERFIESHAVKVNKEWCWKDMEKKFANYQLAWQAGRETLPFEQKLAESNRDKIQEAVESLLWDGNSGLSITGFIADIEAESAVTTSVTGLTSASTAVDIVDAVVAAAQKNKAIKKGFNIFLSHTLFNQYISLLNATCCANRSLIDAAVEELVYPGDSRIKLIPVEGLENSGAVVAATPDALVYATDIEGSENVYKVWYSEDDDKFRFRVLFRAGTALRWPNETILYKPE